MLPCLFCSFVTDDPMELLDHEEAVHGTLVEALEGVDGNEGLEEGPEDLEEED